MPREVAGLVAATPAIAHIAAARGPGGRGAFARKRLGNEESPGSMEPRCRVTPGGSPLAFWRRRIRDSATERTPPGFGGVRSKGCGKSAPRRWRQGRHGKPHRVQDRIGAPHELRFRLGARVGCLRGGATRLLEEWPHIRLHLQAKAEDRTRLTGPLAFMRVLGIEQGPDFLGFDWPLRRGAVSLYRSVDGSAEEDG